MKSIGIIRNIDELGRIVIPKEMRKRLYIESNDPLEIYVDNGKIILSKYEPACVFCADTTDVVEDKGKLVCKKCIEDIKKGL